MSDFLSLSVIISILSFVTSLLTIAIRIGLGSTSPLLSAANLLSGGPQIPQGQATTGGLGQHHADVKFWQWSSNLATSLPFGNSPSALIGSGSPMGYNGGAELVRMNMDWQIMKPGSTKSLPPVYQLQPPVSMAKLIMSRHQRRPNKIPRRFQGNSNRPAQHSRLVESVV